MEAARDAPQVRPPGRRRRCRVRAKRRSALRCARRPRAALRATALRAARTPRRCARAARAPSRSIARCARRRRRRRRGSRAAALVSDVGPPCLRPQGEPLELREVARAIASCSEPVRTPFAPACARPPGAAVCAGLPAHVHRPRCQEPLCRWLAALTHCASEITVRSTGLPKGLSLIACCVQDELEELIAAVLGVTWASDIRVASGAPTPPPLRRARS